MSERIQRHACDLHYLLKATPAVRKAIIDKADSSLISCICECVKNILKGHCALQPKEKKNLAKHKRDLRQLVNKSVPIKEKRRIIQNLILRYKRKKLEGWNHWMNLTKVSSRLYLVISG